MLHASFTEPPTIFQKRVSASLQFLRAVLGYVFFILKIVGITIMGFIMFLSGFPLLKQIAGFLISLLLIYFIGGYLTLLPMYIVIMLLFVPKKIAFPIIGISVFFSFFMIFLF